MVRSLTLRSQEYFSTFSLEGLLLLLEKKIEVENCLKLGLRVTGVDQWFCEIVCEFSSCKMCVCWSPKVFLLGGQTAVWRG